MARYCWLVWSDGYLVCTVNHRKSGVCDLDHGEDEDV